MQIQAIYNNGRIELPPDIELVKKNFPMTITVPAEAVREKSIDADQKFSVRKQIEAIVGPRGLKGQEPSIDCKNEWHEHLEEKYLGK